jgi:flavorubredoxin
MTAALDEIAPDVFRISTYIEDFDLTFNQFLVRDDEPLLFHTGMPAMFQEVRAAVARVLDPSRLRWISFSHFEPDECGALNEWLAAAPFAQPACGLVGAMVSVNHVATRPARVLEDGEVLVTGRRRFRYVRTPHVPHGWDAGLLFEETGKTLFCSDLFTHGGETPRPVSGDVVGPAGAYMVESEKGPFAGYLPFNARTTATMERLAALEPRTIAAMHGASYVGDGASALRALSGVLSEVYGASAPA